MKEDLDHLHAVLLDGVKPPQYATINKKDIKRWRSFFIISICFFMFGFIFFAYLTFKDQLRNFINPIESFITPEERLEREITQLEDEIKNLTIKLNAQSGPIGQTHLGFNQGLIQIPSAMNDLTKEARVRIDPLQLVKTKEYSLEFNIINNNENMKNVGFIWIVALNEGRMLVYPNNGDLSSLPYKFSQGESFSVSKIRPVRATFQELKPKSSILFHIYLFSRDGDLIFYDKSSNYEIP